MDPEREARIKIAEGTRNYIAEKWLDFVRQYPDWRKRTGLDFKLYMDGDLTTYQNKIREAAAGEGKENK